MLTLWAIVSILRMTLRDYKYNMVIESTEVNRDRAMESRRAASVQGRIGRIGTLLAMALAAFGISRTAHAQETWAPVVMLNGVTITVDGVTSPIPNGPVAAPLPILPDWNYELFGNTPFLFPNGFAENARTHEWIVADTYHGRLLRFATDRHPSLAAGTFLGAISTGPTSSPYAPVVDDEGTILVADYNGNAIQVFSSDGQGDYTPRVMTSFVVEGEGGTGQRESFLGPYRVALLPDPVGGVRVAAGVGSVLVLEMDRHRVLKLRPEGGLAATAWPLEHTFGEDANVCQCAGPGIFYYPTGLAVDADRNIYVADPNNATTVSIQVFDEEGTHLQSIAQGLSVPWSLSVGTDGRLFVTDTGNNRIAVFNALDLDDATQQPREGSLEPVPARIGSASQPLGGVGLPNGPNRPGAICLTLTICC